MFDAAAIGNIFAGCDPVVATFDAGEEMVCSIS